MINIVHPSLYEKEAQNNFEDFIRNNKDDIVKIKKPNRSVYLKDGTIHFFMGSERLSKWCKGQTYIIGGKVYKGSFLLNDGKSYD